MFYCFASCKLVIMSDVVVQCDLSLAELDCDLPAYVSTICGRCPLITLQKKTLFTLLVVSW